MIVVIKGDRITALEKAGGVNIPKDGLIIDASGKYLIPGLWDMHVHGEVGYAILFLANGVTGVRHMFGSPNIIEWRKQVAAGNLIGPRIVVGSPLVDGPNPVWKNSIGVATAPEGRCAVRKVRNEGYDFVKVCSLLSRDAYFAVADESNKQGIPFAGHVTDAIGATEASNAGQKSIEHLNGILIGCSSIEKELREQFRQTRKPDGRDVALFTHAMKEAVYTFDEKKASALFSRFVENGTWAGTNAHCTALCSLPG